MKACLMKVNYDRKYITPHQHGQQDSLYARLNLTREIYQQNNKLIADQGHGKKSKTSGEKLVPKPPQGEKKGEQDQVVKQKNDKEINNAKTGKENSKAEKIQGHRDGVAKAHNTIRLKPIQLENNAKTALWVKHNSGQKQRPSMVPNTLAGSPYNQSVNYGRRSVNESGFSLLHRRSQMTLSRGSESTRPSLLESMQFSRSKTMPPPRGVKSAETLESEKKMKKEAEQAIRNKKVFTIIGPYHSLRQGLRRRGWVEKFLNTPEPSAQSPRKKVETESTVEVTQEKAAAPWEEDGRRYGIMSHMVRNCTPSFMFTIKSVDVDSRVIKSNQLVNHYGKAKNLCTKSGLCLNLRQVPWFMQKDPETFYPRCYKVDDAEEKDAFIEDFRLMACVGFMKHFVTKYMDKVMEAECQQKMESEAKIEADNATKVEDAESPPGNASHEESPPADKENAPPGGDKRKESVGTSGDDESSSVKSDQSKKSLKKMIPKKALNIAIEQVCRFLDAKEHEDIDTTFDSKSMSDSAWDQYIQAYYQFVHEDSEVKSASASMVIECQALLARVKEQLTQYELDGHRNVWIVKPGAKSRGRGIQCHNRLEVMLKMIQDNEQGPLVIQKYIERPLLVYNTKFDIRQWFLVTDFNPLTLWFYKDCYLRFCGREYTLEDFHESIHLSNNSVQKHYAPGPRSSKLPEDNMWTSDEFADYLREKGHGEVWFEKVVPGMKDAILCSLLCTQEYIECRKSAFELYGADFMVTEDMQPWLIEINSSPSMARNTKATYELVDSVLEDTLKVVLDRRENKNCDCGRFELLYRQPSIQDPPQLDYSLSINGKKIRKPFTKR